MPPLTNIITALAGSKKVQTYDRYAYW